jgi:alkylation response protein AidB-like acyl-CoA dehydrogenase
MTGRDRHIEDEAAYRERARNWVADNLTPIPPGSDSWGQRAGETELEFVARSRLLAARLHDGGYTGITIAADWGGRGLTGRHRQIFEEEAAGRERPGYFAADGGPVLHTLLTTMSDDLKRPHVPAMLRGEELWCQLMSEPGAGSDLGAVVTRAELDGDEWVLNGQKVWTTGAHFCDYAICLARTDWDATKYSGLTMFFVPLRHAGVTVKPLRQIDGSAAFCEVFLDDARIPAENVLGAPNDGWGVVQTWLTYEHGGVAKGDESRTVGAARSLVDSAMPTELVELAAARHLLDEPDVRGLIVGEFVARAINTLLGRRVGIEMRAGRMPGSAGSLGRVSGSEHQQQSSSLALNLAGIAGVAWEDADAEAASRVSQMLEARALTIRGGTKEIQRNMIGERLLGLPREPPVDRGIPFREVRTNALPPRRSV